MSHSKTKNSSAATPADHLIPSLLVFCYAFTSFIPNFNAGDVMGVQWLYLNLLNIITAGYIFFRRTALNDNHIIKVIGTAPILLYLFVFIWALASISVAMNKTESIVTLARLLNSVVMVVNLSILFYRTTRLLFFATHLLGAFLIIESINTIASFFNGLGEKNLDEIILGLTGNAGNKNILAASLVVKIPFAIYGIIHFTNWKRILSMAALALGSMAIFLINARSAYISLLLITIIFLISHFLIQKTTSIKNRLSSVAMVVLPIVFTFFLSNQTIRKAIDQQEEATGYGTVLDRLNSISLSTEGSNSRTFLWKGAIDFIQHHPVIGSGFGNWKLASIPYEKNYADEFLVSAHAHNDFLELTAETGLPGGIGYILLFVFIGIGLIKIILSSQKPPQTRQWASILLMGLTAYSMDAFLNFPMERPVMQSLFAIIVGGSVSIIIQQTVSKKTPVKFSFLKNPAFIGSVMAIFLIPSLYITWSTFQSFKIQQQINYELKTGNLLPESAALADNLPSIPNMNAYCYPNEIIRAMYRVEQKKYDESISLLKKGENVNPFLPIADFYRSRIFLEKNNLDSAKYYAEKALLLRPRSGACLSLLTDINMRKKDSAALSVNFTEFLSRRNEAWVWNTYIERMKGLPAAPGTIQQLVQRGLQLFPADATLLEKNKQLADLSTNEASANSEEIYRQNFEEGLALSGNKRYAEAIEKFIKASSAKPEDYVSVENIGVCYYSMGQYDKALGFLDKVLTNFMPSDGKSELIKGLCLLSKGNKNGACLFFDKAISKGNKLAGEQKMANCK